MHKTRDAERVRLGAEAPRHEGRERLGRRGRLGEGAAGRPRGRPAQEPRRLPGADREGRAARRPAARVGRGRDGRPEAGDHVGRGQDRRRPRGARGRAWPCSTTPTSREDFQPMLSAAANDPKTPPNVRAAAMGALPLLGTGKTAKANFATLARFLKDGPDRDVAARAIMQLPRESWDKAAAGPVVESILAWAKTVPADQRSEQPFVETLHAGSELAGLHAAGRRLAAPQGTARAGRERVRHPLGPRADALRHAAAGRRGGQAVRGDLRERRLHAPQPGLRPARQPPGRRRGRPEHAAGRARPPRPRLLPPEQLADHRRHARSSSPTRSRPSSSSPRPRKATTSTSAPSPATGRRCGAS